MQLWYHVHIQMQWHRSMACWDEGWVGCVYHVASSREYCANLNTTLFGDTCCPEARAVRQMLYNCIWALKAPLALGLYDIRTLSCLMWLELNWEHNLQPVIFSVCELLMGVFELFALDMHSRSHGQFWSLDEPNPLEHISCVSSCDPEVEMCFSSMFCNTSLKAATAMTIPAEILTHWCGPWEVKTLPNKNLSSTCKRIFVDNVLPCLSRANQDYCWPLIYSPCVPFWETWMANHSSFCLFYPSLLLLLRLRHLDHQIMIRIQHTWQAAVSFSVSMNLDHACSWPPSDGIERALGPHYIKQHCFVYFLMPSRMTRPIEKEI